MTERIGGEAPRSPEEQRTGDTAGSDTPTPRPPAVASAMRTFHHILVNTAVANTTTSYLWWALTFWAYLETRNVLATGLIGGAYMLFVSFSSILFGSVVDHRRKLAVMRLSTTLTFTAFAGAAAIFLILPEDTITDLGQPWFWLFAVVILVGAVVEHMRNIALSTTVTLLVPDGERDKANGLVGVVQGVAFMVTSIISGLSVGMLGMGWTLGIALALTGLTLAHLLTIRFAEDRVAAGEGGSARQSVDLRGSIAVIRAAQGLFALIVFSTFNNLIGGVYMALMDPYGLELLSVQSWGFVLAVSSTGFLIGGAVVAKLGLGRNPMRTMLLLVLLMGALGATFTIREYWIVYAVGIWLYMALVPAVEAAEQTVIQRVVPFERQGRVFGFAMSLETAAAPITAFVIAPLAELWIIPWARTDEGAEALRPLLGDGNARGIALVFFAAGLIMVFAAIAAFLTPVYRAVSRTYAQAAPQGGPDGAASDGEAGSPDGVAGQGEDDVAGVATGPAVRAGVLDDGS